MLNLKQLLNDHSYTLLLMIVTLFFTLILINY
ncbi:hypothetical protein BCI9360_03855 [Bacillus sp. CECT 9360]|nr:hypothetical protein BCI9360_03855 [Bacillus sp. CECT 9360]